VSSLQPSTTTWCITMQQHKGGAISHADYQRIRGTYQGGST
jgi:hypothetical protein